MTAPTSVNYAPDDSVVTFDLLLFIFGNILPYIFANISMDIGPNITSCSTRIPVGEFWQT
jgi:hypothetical protein